MSNENRILLIDDDQIFLKMLQKLLTGQIAVDIAPSYEAVMDCLSHHTYTFLFIDYDLTGPFKSDGIDLFEELEKKYKVRGYVMSSYGESLRNFNDKVNTSGISGLLSKDNIIQEIKDILGL